MANMAFGTSATTGTTSATIINSELHAQQIKTRDAGHVMLYHVVELIATLTSGLTAKQSIIYATFIKKGKAVHATNVGTATLVIILNAKMATGTNVGKSIICVALIKARINALQTDTVAKHVKPAAEQTGVVGNGTTVIKSMTFVKTIKEKRDAQQIQDTKEKHKNKMLHTCTVIVKADQQAKTATYSVAAATLYFYLLVLIAGIIF